MLESDEVISKRMTLIDEWNGEMILYRKKQQLNIKIFKVPNENNKIMIKLPKKKLSKTEINRHLREIDGNLKKGLGFPRPPIRNISEITMFGPGTLKNVKYRPKKLTDNPGQKKLLSHRPRAGLKIIFGQRGSYQGSKMHTFDKNVFLFSDNDTKIYDLFKFISKHITPKKKTTTKTKQRGGDKRKSLNKSRILSKTNYEEYIKKKSKKKLTKKQTKSIDHTLFIKYCKCIKSLKYNPKIKPGLEYPICTSSIYKKRKFSPPKNIRSKCKQYR